MVRQCTVSCTCRRHCRSDESPPVLLAIHGGPNHQARPIYDAAFQYLLTRGIAVFDLNFRGSTGYGKRFTRLDNGRLRPNAVKDIAAAVGWLAATGKVDASNVAVMGDSYGGYMTLAATDGFSRQVQGWRCVFRRVELGDQSGGGATAVEGH